MYDKFFLSKDQLKIINNCSLNQILIIYGSSGIGKTSLAKEILKDRVITLIDNLFLKNNDNIYEYLLNIIRKKNITMMFEKSKSERGIIIDNLEVFHKYDKKIYKSILNLLNSNNFYGTKIIITCNNKFIIHRSLSKLNLKKLYLNYDKHLFHKIGLNIIKERDLSLDFDQREQLLKKSNFNLNTFNSLLETNHRIKTSPLDNYDSTEKLTENIIKQKINLKDIIRLYESEKITISLNLLENIFTYIQDINLISEIYKSYEISDIIETISINYNINDYYTILTIYKIYIIFKKYKIKDYKPFLNNNYISRSTINIYYQKLSSNFIMNEFMIYPYLYAINFKIKLNHNIYKIIKNLNKKELEFYIKSFNYFYNCKVNIKKINKFLLL